jgi:hypothetical protein
MACGLFPLSASFTLGEIADREMPMSKLTLPLPEFPVAKLSGETDDRFRAMVELAAVGAIGRYAHGEHDPCIAVVLNNGHLNRVFEQAEVPYGPCLVPGSEASKEAVKQRKNDSGAGLAGKRMKVSGRKAMVLNAPAAPKVTGAALSKVALAKAANTKSVPKSSVALGSSVPLKAGASSKTIISKTEATVIAPKVGVLRISTRTKRPSAASSQAPKGKQARVDVMPPLATAATHKAMVRPHAMVESDDG